MIKKNEGMNEMDGWRNDIMPHTLSEHSVHKHTYTHKEREREREREREKL